MYISDHLLLYDPLILLSCRLDITYISSRSSFLLSCIEREHGQSASLAHEEVKA